MKIKGSLKLFFIIWSVLFLSKCVSSIEESIQLFENRLESFKGKQVRDVINAFGQPNKYINKPDTNIKEQDGTYMVYDYRPKNDDCVIMFKYAKKTLKIIDWDYEGNCLLFDGK